MKALTRMIRNLFGLSSDDTETEAEPQESEITVEREPATASEDAVKGTETATDAGADDVSGSAEVSAVETTTETSEPATDDEPETVDAATEMSGSETETVGEEPDEEVAFEEEEEPIAEETVSDESADESTDEPETPVTAEEATDEPEPEATAEESTDETAAVAEPVDEISGIGRTYKDRLGGIGIETVADLADSDTATVAEAAEVSDSRASDWIDRAQKFA